MPQVSENKYPLPDRLTIRPMALPSILSAPKRILSKKYTGTKESARALCETWNKVYSNKYRDTQIDGGNKCFITKPSAKKGMYDIWEIKGIK